MVRVIPEDLETVRLPYSFKSVPSLTGEGLCEEIIKVAAGIKKSKIMLMTISTRFSKNKWIQIWKL